MNENYRTARRQKNKRKHRFSLIFILLLMILLSAVCYPYFFPQDKTVVISHRGASGDAPEHTFAAYDLAIDYGSEYIEQDLVMSKDKTLYISHDQNALRLTGSDQEYSEMSAQEIESLHAQANREILTLEEVFKKYKNSVNYVIEFKSRGQIDSFHQLVEKYDLEKNIIVQSFHYDDLKAINKIYPKMTNMLLVYSLDNLEEYLMDDKLAIICFDKKIVTKDSIQQVQAHGKKAYAYTLDTSEEFSTLMDMGIDGFFTNYTKEALAYIEKTE